jgi:uncharacterized membrane protein
MEALLHGIAGYIALGIEAVAIAIIAAGSLEAVVEIVRTAFHPETSNRERRDVWLKFARWLIAALTFQMAADIVNTSFEPTWDELGRLGTIAVIRTFLSFFLDREVQDTRSLQRDSNRGVSHDPAG